MSQEKVKTPLNILIDWNGTITKEEATFDKLVNPFLDSPTHEHDEIQHFYKWDHPEKPLLPEGLRELFFSDSVLAPYAVNVINKFLGKEANSSDSQTFIVHDETPNFGQHTDFKMASGFDIIGLEVNGMYVASDKINLAKVLGADVAIEDDPRIAVALCLSGIKCILMLKKWNRFFSIDALSLSMREEKVEKVKENLSIAEDWLDVNMILKSYIKERNLS
jgi:hypothetical protein